VQVELRFESAWFQRLKLIYDELLSNFALNVSPALLQQGINVAPAVCPEKYLGFSNQPAGPHTHPLLSSTLVPFLWDELGQVEVSVTPTWALHKSTFQPQPEIPVSLSFCDLKHPTLPQKMLTLSRNTQLSHQKMLTFTLSRKVDAV